jgi:DNA polymerase I-like protein with 3'-5' exonuclease and polymerase domains
MVMMVHDAIWVDAPAEEAEWARILMEDSMKHAVEFFLVPLEVDFKD